ncbi:MAG: hypothetical protein NTX95_04540 [Actinobacteria bacterium]|nr:hypothetical protein [Actinomycetota bacterium]
MAKKKQREREERYRRHGVERPESPQREIKAAHPDDAPAKGKGKSGSKSRSSAPRGRKPVPYPTLRRSLIRAPIFGLMWFAISRFLLSGASRTINEDLTQAVILTAAMIPLLYFADKVTYTLAKRRDQPVGEPGPDGWLGFKR